MLAVRKLTATAATAWSKAILEDTPFDDLNVSVIANWQSMDNQVSIYVIKDASELALVAMALSMQTGDGPKGSAFACIDYARLKSTGLFISKTASKTFVNRVDDCHHDVILKKGKDIRLLLDCFLQGEVRSANASEVESLALGSVDDGSYDFPIIAASRKGKAANEAQGVCGSALTLVSKTLLEIRTP